MSKAAEKREHQKENYRKATTKLERMLEAYAAGHTEIDGNPFSAQTIADEITAKYRAMKGCLQDENGVSFDGPLARDVLSAMEATKNRFGAK